MEKTTSSEDIDHDEGRVNGLDGTSLVGVGKPPRYNQKTQVSVLSHNLDLFVELEGDTFFWFQ